MIHVNDVNDNPPVFDRPTYETQITEEDDRNLPKRVLKVLNVWCASLFCVVWFSRVLGFMLINFILFFIRMFLFTFSTSLLLLVLME